ncbi:hypothetical protein YB2330_006549 [Saitoella coloradoensis]
MTILTARLKQILPDPTLLLLQNPSSPSQTRQIAIHGITIPRLRREGDEDGAWDAREYLRKMLVGKVVTFSIVYKAGGGAGSGREYARVWIEGGEELALHLLRAGWAKLRSTTTSSSSSSEDNTAAYAEAESTARAASLGLWSPTPSTPNLHASYDNPPNPASFLAQWQVKEVEAVIEQVRAGDLVRARLLLSPTEHQYLPLILAGLRCPTSPRTDPTTGAVVDAGEEYGDAARAFTEARLLQRSVKVQLLGTTSSGGQFVANVIHPAGDIASLILASGLGRVVDWMSGMVGVERMGVLRAAEARGRSARVGVWKNTNTPTPTVGKEKGSDEGVVVRIVSADTISILVQNTERRIRLSSLRAPRATDSAQAPFATPAREWLRRRVIGKTVRVQIDGSTKPSPDADSIDVATVTIGNTNVGLEGVQKGWLSVLRHRAEDTHRAPGPIYDALIAAESAAQATQVGMWSPKGAVGAASSRVVDASESVTRAKGYINALTRAGRVSGVVEHVFSGNRFKILLKHQGETKVTFVLRDVRSPRSDESHGKQAVEYATRRFLQRDVEVEINSVDRGGAFMGSMFLGGRDVGVGMVEEGMGWVGEYVAGPGAGVLREAEGRARDSKKGLWKDYQPEAVVREGGEKENGSGEREYVDVVVTEVESAGRFWVQIITPKIQELEILMRDLQVASSSSTASLSGPPRVGDQLQARSAEDGLWYRARVRRVDRAAGKAEVVFVDYGNTEHVPFANLRLGSSSGLPPQAQEATLSFIRSPPAGSEYAEDACDFLASLITNRQLVASIDRRPGGSPLELTLYDPANSASVEPSESVNAEMVKEGMCRVVPLKERGWEKAFAGVLRGLEERQEDARRGRRGIWEYGDVFGDDE